MKHVISLGFGVQSSTMAMLAAEGAITPMPDAAVFADTQREPASVYRWIDWLRPRLPFPVHIVTAGDLGQEEQRIRISGTSGVRYRRPLIPAYLDGGAPAFRHCTQDFKLRPLFKAYRDLFGVAPATKSVKVTQWVGISLDEAVRMKPSRYPWCESRWPLIYDLPMTRMHCREWWDKRGYPQPPRSACYFCPYHSDDEWKRLKEQEPEDFARAVQFERDVQETCDHAGQARVFLHRSLKPIGEVVFKGDNNLDLFGEECEGMCGV